MKRKQSIAWGDIALVNAFMNPDIPKTWMTKPPASPSVKVKSEFDSELEHRRYNVLLEWQDKGRIKSLIHHPPVFILQEGFYHPSRKRKVEAVTWEPDYIYTQVATDYEVIEDIKGKHIFANFKTKLPFILSFLRDKHVYINHEDVNGWYIPEGKKTI